MMIMVMIMMMKMMTMKTLKLLLLMIITMRIMLMMMITMTMLELSPKGASSGSWEDPPETTATTTPSWTRCRPTTPRRGPGVWRSP